MMLVAPSLWGKIKLSPLRAEWCVQWLGPDLWSNPAGGMQVLPWNLRAIFLRQVLNWLKNCISREGKGKQAVWILATWGEMGKTVCWETSIPKIKWIGEQKGNGEGSSSVLLYNLMFCTELHICMVVYCPFLWVVILNNETAVWYEWIPRIEILYMQTVSKPELSISYPIMTWRAFWTHFWSFFRERVRVIS